MTPTKNPLTILAVDDDATLLGVLSRILKRDGHTVVPASGVAEALELANTSTPDLALIDLSLPDGDGVQLADGLRERYPALPLILMTAYPIRIREDPEIASRFKRVMIKPLNLEELRGAIREASAGEPAAETLPSYAPEAAATSPAPASEAPAAWSAPPSSDPWRRLKSGALAAVVLVVLAGFVVYISGVPIPGLSAGPEVTASPPAPLAVDLAPNMPHTLIVPDDVKKALGIRKGNKDDVDTAAVPTQMPPLVLTGSTALDPNRFARPARFAPAKVVQIGLHHPDAEEIAYSGTKPRSCAWRPVRKGDLLGVFYSEAVGSQKNALFDSESQRRLDQDILDRAGGFQRRGGSFRTKRPAERGSGRQSQQPGGQHPAHLGHPGE